MASKFGSNGRICEGIGCKGLSDVISYCPLRRKNLCTVCAKGIPPGQLNLTCDTHNKPMRRFCETHKKGVCSVCVKRKHRNNKCQLRPIEEAMVVEDRGRLLRLKEDLEDQVKMYETYNEELDQQKEKMFEQLDAIKKNVDDTIDEIIRKDRAREMKEARRISRETEENRKHYAQTDKVSARRRELRLQREKRTEMVERKRAELLANIQSLSDQAEEEFARVDEAHDESLKSEIDAILQR